MSRQSRGSKHLLEHPMLLEKLFASSTAMPGGESLCPWRTNSCSNTLTRNPFAGPHAETKYAGGVLGVSRAKIKFLRRQVKV